MGLRRIGPADRDVPARQPPEVPTWRRTCSRPCCRPPGRARSPAGVAHDRPGHRQRHRHPRCAGLAPSRVPDPDPAGHRDPRRAQRQRHLRQRRPRRVRGAGRGRRGHHRQRRPGVQPTAPWSAAPRPRRAPAASTCTGSATSSSSGKQLLDHISLIARPGTLTAIIGGSGAGKTTLARLIAGYTQPSSGTVTFEGHNIHSEYASLRSRIGMVPQDDVVHRQLTVNQALNYAAELRLPPDTSKADRAQVVAQVLEELELTKHADTRVDKLSGGQRKRASVALELLTGPSLLILDEPTSGLDPALDRQVMMMLRQLADAGRVVLVVTHSVSYLDVCDQLLLVAPGGKTAYWARPARSARRWAPPTGPTSSPRWAPIPRRPTVASWPQNQPPLAPPAESESRRPGRTGTHRVFGGSSRRSRAARSGWSSPTAATRVPGAAALHHRCPDPHRSRQERFRHVGSAGQRSALSPTRFWSAQRWRGVHGYRADHSRSHRRACDLPARTSGRTVHGAYLRAKIVVFSVFAIVQAAIATAISVVGWGTPLPDAVIWATSTVNCSSPSPRRVWPRRCSAWRCRRWPNRKSRSCRCWWCRS